MAQTSEILEGMKITNQFLELKFKISPMENTLANENFHLYRYMDASGATPVNAPDIPISNFDIDSLSDIEAGGHIPILNPFQMIETRSHYNSVSRVLTLFFTNSDNMDSGWYVLGLGEIRRASGDYFKPEAIIFAYQQSNVQPAPLGTTPTEFTIIDKSIKTHAFGSGLSEGDPEGTSGAFRIVSTDPEVNALFVEEDYNDGTIKIEFSQRPAIWFLDDKYFKTQKKEFTSIGRWKTIDTKLAIDSDKPIVYVYLPSVDDDHVYKTPGRTYFESNHKYRVRVNGSIGISQTT